jgi:hypothetical protein
VRELRAEMAADFLKSELAIPDYPFSTMFTAIVTSGRSA